MPVIMCTLLSLSGQLMMSSGTLRIGDTASVNGPAILTSGNVTIDVGATLYYNGELSKGNDLQENIQGTASVLDPGRNHY